MSEEKMLAELTKIRELLTPPAPPPPSAKPKNIFQEFLTFLDKYKVFPMAVAFIMGAYVGQVIQAVVDDLIMPIIQFALPADLAWEDWPEGPFRLGHFFGTLLTFIIVAAVIFLLVKLMSMKVKIPKSAQELKDQLKNPFKKKE